MDGLLRYVDVCGVGRRMGEIPAVGGIGGTIKAWSAQGTMYIHSPFVRAWQGDRTVAPARFLRAHD